MTTPTTQAKKQARIYRTERDLSKRNRPIRVVTVRDPEDENLVRWVAERGKRVVFRIFTLDDEGVQKVHLNEHMPADKAQAKMRKFYKEQPTVGGAK